MVAVAAIVVVVVVVVVVVAVAVVVVVVVVVVCLIGVTFHYKFIRQCFEYDYANMQLKPLYFFHSFLFVK